MVGSDPLLNQVLQAGGAGCICAVSNLCAPELRVVFDGWDDPARAADVARAQARLAGVACGVDGLWHSAGAIKGAFGAAR